MSDPPHNPDDIDDAVAWLNRATDELDRQERIAHLVADHGANPQSDGEGTLVGLALMSGETISYDETTGTWANTTDIPGSDALPEGIRHRRLALAAYLQVSDQRDPGIYPGVLELLAAELATYDPAATDSTTTRKRLHTTSHEQRIALVMCAAATLRTIQYPVMDTWLACLEDGYPAVGMLLTIVGAAFTVSEKLGQMVHLTVDTFGTDDIVQVMAVLMAGVLALKFTPDDVATLLTQPLRDPVTGATLSVHLVHATPGE